MKKAERKHHGVTLLEIILVLVITSAILLLSIQQYSVFRKQADIDQLKSNVDILFAAMTNYYRANCNQPSLVSDGTGVSLDTLIQNGYLTETLHKNPLVNYASAPYAMQFIEINGGNLPARQAIITSWLNQGVTSPTGPTTSIGKVYATQIQISVALKNTQAAKQYLSLLNGSCLSALGSCANGSGSCVTPCESNPTGTSYVVFQRIPSASSGAALSDFWLSLPTVTQFTQMYGTMPIGALIDPTQTFNTSQYFICGS